MVYYGYVHECAELYGQLWSESREEWNRSVNIIVNVIMKYKNFRIKMEFKDEFSNKQAKFLLKNNTYNYYRLGVWLYNTRSLKCFTKFINSIEQYSSDLFYNVSIGYIESNYSFIQALLETYFDKKFEGQAVEITHIKDKIQRLLFQNIMNRSNFFADNSMWKRWNVLSLLPKNFRNLDLQNDSDSGWNRLTELRFHKQYFNIEIKI